MKKAELIDFGQERIRVLHFTWIAFFVTFYVWFNMAPLATTMLASMDWLTREHMAVLAICNVALTIPARIIVGALIDKYGPRIVFSLLMITMSIPAFFFAFGDTFTQLLVSRLILGSIGAGFVIGIRMVAQWFPKNMIGRAEGFYAGWGNFGSAWAAMTLPWIGITFFGDTFGLGDDGWRWALAFNGLVSLVYGIAYPFLVRDLPGGEKFKGTAKADPMTVSSWGDLIQYLAWSFPLVGAMMILTWRLSNVMIDGAPVISGWPLYAVYGVLTLVYVAHVAKTLQINVPILKAGVPEEDKYHWGSVAALNSTYFANFGAELAVVSMLPMFFENTFSQLQSSEGNYIMTATLSGVIAASFAFVNLLARPLGGLLSDTMKNRKRTMLTYMVGIAFGFLGMASIGQYGEVVDGQQMIVPMFDGTLWLVIAVVITILCSMFVQGAEGATFAVIPMIKKDMTGQIAGMAGAYGNVGAVVYLVIYSLVDAKTFFYIIAAGAALSFVYCFFALEEPSDAFAEEMF
ncbi:MAG: MFS transporter [Gemmatimonadales bacterium]|jgi:NNP family nitrate/nitrite transporter-like MFS transporter|nr:MFS transporter [Gemmatimonadales bacterium]MBT3499830.1 MFS transporter [Gemmatimonadales bacterium]MBT3774457.1 MFS transporter [Gemmatimonadales bacterium]MBT3958092.1 MFS transporter [Gemmatimonadales bacterium]MBT4189138.1 MFS transporter [Gemmatimonadales bacterium]